MRLESKYEELTTSKKYLLHIQWRVPYPKAYYWNEIDKIMIQDNNPWGYENEIDVVSYTVIMRSFFWKIELMCFRALTFNVNIRFIQILQLLAKAVSWEIKEVKPEKCVENTHDPLINKKSSGSRVY